MHSPFLDSLSQDEKNNLRLRLFKRQNELCFICQEKIDLVVSEVDVDHIKPISRNGLNVDDESNFAITHSSCNRSKGDNDLNVARAIAKIKNIQKDFSEKWIKNSNNYDGKHTQANLGDLLEFVGGAKYELKYRIENDEFIYSLSEIGDNTIYKAKIFTDTLSKTKTCLIELPIEYCYHDDFINPRAINSSVAKLIKEFYLGNVQLQVSLARINEDEKKVYIFDGQHKSSAQIVLGVRKLLVRLFIDCEKEKLLEINKRAGTELRQIEFNKNVIISLNQSLYSDKVKQYQRDMNLQEDDFNFTEKQLFDHFKGGVNIRPYIIDNQKHLVVHSPENKLNRFINFEGKSTKLPISYSTFSKSFLPLFIDSKTLAKGNLDDENCERYIEYAQLIQLQNMIAEKIFIDKFDTEVGIDRIENKILSKNDTDITDEHLVAYRLAKDEIMNAWLELLQGIIYQSLSNNFKIVGVDNAKQNCFKIKFDDIQWKHIDIFLDKFVGLPIWKNRGLSDTVFGGKKLFSYWRETLEKGITPDGQDVMIPFNVKSFFHNIL